MASTRFSNVTFRDSVLKDSPLLKLNDTNSFAEVDNCTFENVVLRGDGSSVIKLFTNSTFSGKLKNIGFREDDDHRFGIGLDLSNAELDKVSFTGIDMRRIKCNPAWSDYIVDDWYKYAGALKQIVADCLGDDYGYVMGGRSPEQSAAAYLHYDLLRDEIDYGGPADEARGAKFLDYLYNSRDPEARAHMINFYRQAGIDPPNLPS